MSRGAPRPWQTSTTRVAREESAWYSIENCSTWCWRPAPPPTRRPSNQLGLRRPAASKNPGRSWRTWPIWPSTAWSPASLTTTSPNLRRWACARSRHGGVDFLADDGGLTAILGTVVVKLHADTIRDMLLARVESTALPAPEKSALVKQIKALPAMALQAVASRATQEGLAHIPDLWHWLQGTLTR